MSQNQSHMVSGFLCMSSDYLVKQGWTYFPNYKAVDPNLMECLIKIRFLKWMVATGGLREELEGLWRVNPMRAFLLRSKKSDETYWVWWNTNFIGYTDRAWKKLSTGAICSSIGEHLTDINKNVLFFLSCPLLAWFPLEAKRNDVIFLYKQIKLNLVIQDSFIFCTDSII